jgi:hypothetical protein
VVDNSERYMRRNEAAEYLKDRFGFCTTRSLAKLACLGGGPAFRRIGRLPVYTRSDLDAWAQSKITAPVCSTSEYRGAV